MYSRHRVAGYSIDHVIKFLFFLLVPVVILDIMISCFVIFSMRSQSIQSLQDTTSLYASQIDTAHISINRYLIRLLTENDDACRYSVGNTGQTGIHFIRRTSS